MVREHLVEETNSHQLKAGHGMIRKSHFCFISSTKILNIYKGVDEMLYLRWNSQHGSVYVDGSHYKVCIIFQ